MGARQRIYILILKTHTQMNITSMIRLQTHTLFTITYILNITINIFPQRASNPLLLASQFLCGHQTIYLAGRLHMMLHKKRSPIEPADRQI